jgi:hypothetical protein
MMNRLSIVFICLAVLICLPSTVSAKSDFERVYIPAADEIIIYNADLAQLTQRFTIEGNDPFRIDVTQALLPNTLRVRVDGVDVPLFTLTAVPASGQNYSSSTSYYNYDPYHGNSPQVTRYWLDWDNANLDGADVQLTYLVHGISWSARYTCDVIDDETVHFLYTAEIDNRMLKIDDCRIRLLSGIVAGINQQEWNNMTATQRGGLLYNSMEAGYSSSVETQVTLNVHEVYEIGERNLEPGKMTCIALYDGTLDQSKHLVWDAREDREKAGKVQVIYKIMNDTDAPFAAGTVQVYEDDIFIGMDPMEMTPIGSPGHITIGESMDFRVFRYQKDEYLSTKIPGLPSWVYNKHTVTLEVRYFGKDPATLEILDSSRGYNRIVKEIDGEFIEDERYDNLMKFELDVKNGDKKTIEYVYYTS